MKWMIASDIHGSAYYCNELLMAYKREKGRPAAVAGRYFISWTKK